jgi:hypothetical protein
VNTGGTAVGIGGNTHTIASASQTGGGGTISFSLTTQALTGVSIVYQYAATPIPEPVSAVLLGSGLLGLGAMRMRRRKI